MKQDVLNNMQRTKTGNGTYESRKERNKLEQRDVKEDQSKKKKKQ